MRKLIRPLAFTAALGMTGSVGLTVLRAVPDEPKPAVKAEAPAAPVKFTNEKIETKFAVTPKPLSAAVKNGIEFLVKSQQEDGGWSQGGGWRTTAQGGGRVEGKNVEDPSDIGNTCFVVLALIRSGCTPVEGEHKVGDRVDVSMFSSGDIVDVAGISKGKGFAGGFRGRPAQSCLSMSRG